MRQAVQLIVGIKILPPVKKEYLWIPALWKKVWKIHEKIHPKESKLGKNKGRTDY